MSHAKIETNIADGAESIWCLIALRLETVNGVDGVWAGERLHLGGRRFHMQLRNLGLSDLRVEREMETREYYH